MGYGENEAVKVPAFTGHSFTGEAHRNLYSRGSALFVINLDTAVQEVPFPANIDVCDIAKHKELMKQYGLGPSSGIVTSLNLCFQIWSGDDIYWEGPEHV